MYKTANSCVDSCSAAECGSAYASRNNPVTSQSNLGSCDWGAWGEVFRDCADIVITGSGSGTSCPAAPSGYSLNADMDHGGDDIACSNGNDLNTAASECNSNPSCKAFNLVYGGWQGRCIKTVATPMSAARGVCFYTKKSGGGCSRRYTIKSGDTCWALGGNTQSGLDRILSLNPGIDCTNLQIGQSVCIA